VYVLRFDPGEELVSGLAAFCKESAVPAAWISAIGGVREATLAFYNIESKQYEDREFRELLEIVGCSGNASRSENSEIILHVHGVFSRPDGETIGGHIKKAVISATCEVRLECFLRPITKRKDGATGLMLME